MKSANVKPYDSFRQLFKDCSDVQVNKLMVTQKDGSSSEILLVYCDGLCDVNTINQVFIPFLIEMFKEHTISNNAELKQYLPFQLSPLPQDWDAGFIISKIFNGELLVYFQDAASLYTWNLANAPQRKTEESNAELSVRGPRDGFTEDTRVNVALIRKRLKTNALAVEEYTLGTQTQTKTVLLYMKDAINPAIVKEITSKLASVKVKGLISSTQLEEALVDYAFFSKFVYTGRPDFAVNSLMHGRFVIIVEGSPTVIIGPINLTFMFNTSEDAYTLNWFVMFTRLLRLCGIFLSVFLPGFWIALLTYHQDQLPFTLLGTLVFSRQGVPLPAPLEAVMMILLFELFREAGMRLPSSIGQTISVVGGLIVGQAAISAGMTAPGILVVVAISVLASFTMVNQNMVGFVSLLRLIVLVISGVLGLFGLLICILALAVYIVNLESFGVKYLSPVSPISYRDMFKILFRMPWGKKEGTPRFFKKNGDDQT
ncbi:spore germination protein [Paenibacillus montanisoli]|uniref:Spore germination protein n=2 Tax=Paenibacillus montanisoli TaxID=2081970 RepID=A0A328UF62_9BACL|nr:spore germination protein [Paenibacillus montanisoli]